MSSLSLVLILFGMFVVTFGIRFVLLARAHKVVMPDSLERALKFVPVAVLTAIITPMILTPNHYFDVSINNPWLLGGFAAFIVGVWMQKQLLTIVVGVVVFFAAKYFSF